RELLPVVAAADEQLEPAAQPSALRRAHAAAAIDARRSTNSFAARQYASAPAEHLSYAITGRPCDGASASRTDRGIVVRNTRSPKCLRTSSATSEDSFVRPSTIVRSTPLMRRRGLSRARTSSTDFTSCERPSSAKNSAGPVTRTGSAAASALTVSGPSEGGQSRKTNSEASRAPPSDCARYDSPSSR